VNQEFVDRYLKGKDPLATRILIEEIIPGVQKLGPPVEWQIVGVFQNVLYGDFREAYPEVDVPFAQSLSPSVAIALRTDHDPAEMSKTVAAAVHSVDSQVPLAHLRTLEDVKEESLGEDRFTMILFAGFAGLALLLAAVGIYGLMAFSVSQRTQEMGLRLALGATQLHVIRLILRDASILAAVGLGLGLAGSVFVGRTMRSTLYGVGTLDYSVLLLVSGLLVVTALVASYVPARRAASIDPMKALRTE
jgi:putative ABC transport system permease protein